MNIRKSIISVLSVLLFGSSLYFASCSSTNDPTNNTNSTSSSTGLSVSVVTSTANGNYAPRNVVAIWVEDSSGKFVKSLTVYAAQRKYDLTKWQSSSSGNTTDAVTGATRTSFGTITAKWNGKDVSGTEVADGSYKVCMELTDKSTTGNYAEFTFIKGTAESTSTPGNVPSFSSISIKWMPL